jgi:general stress protein 26
VSVSGVARVSKNRTRIRQLYKEDWKSWLGDQGGERDGGPTDPRIALILVDADYASYMKANKSRPVILFEVIRSFVTGNRPAVGDVREVTGAELMD